MFPTPCMMPRDHVVHIGAYQFLSIARSSLRSAGSCNQKNRVRIKSCSHPAGRRRLGPCKSQLQPFRVTGIPVPIHPCIPRGGSHHQVPSCGFAAFPTAVYGYGGVVVGHRQALAGVIAAGGQSAIVGAGWRRGGHGARWRSKKGTSVWAPAAGALEPGASRRPVLCRTGLPPQDLGSGVAFEAAAK